MVIPRSLQTEEQGILKPSILYSVLNLGWKRINTNLDTLK